MAKETHELLNKLDLTHFPPLCARQFFSSCEGCVRGNSSLFLRSFLSLVTEFSFVYYGSYVAWHQWM